MDPLQRLWYGGGAVPWRLRALAGVYGALTALRRALYRWRVLPRLHVGVPVVVVGNLTVGGAGKTPLTIALVEGLRARGWKPGVVSRGYGGSARGVRRVDADATPALVGDEPYLIQRRTGAPVVVGRDRVAAAREFISVGDVDVVLADDGLQHYRLARDVEICVIDGRRRFGNGRLMPAGPLREPLTRLPDMAFRVCNGGSAQAGEIAMRLEPGPALRVGAPEVSAPLAGFAGRRVHAVAGIGDPARFFDTLRAAGVEPVEHAFPDHHAYTAADLDFGDDLAVLMTEKDAVKCRAFALPQWWFLPVRAVLPDSLIDAVAARVQAARQRGA